MFSPYVMILISDLRVLATAAVPTDPARPPTRTRDAITPYRDPPGRSLHLGGSRQGSITLAKLVLVPITIAILSSAAAAASHTHTCRLGRVDRFTWAAQLLVLTKRVRVHIICNVGRACLNPVL
jgi:hypothetical protein